MTDTRQLTRQEFDSLSRAQIRAALKAGQLTDLMAGKNPEPAQAETVEPAYAAASSDGQGRTGDPIGNHGPINSREQLKTMSAVEIVEAHRAGRLDGLKKGNY